MPDQLSIAEEMILAPAELTDTKLATVLGQLLRPSVDYADLYFQSSYFESWSLEESIVKAGNFTIDRGVGVRVISGEKTGFAYSDDIILPALTQAANAAVGIVKQGDNGSLPAWQVRVSHDRYPILNPLQSISEQDKIEILNHVDQYARQLDPRIIQVNASLVAAYDVIYVVASDGVLAADVRPLVRMNVSVIAEHHKKLESGSFGGGGRSDLSLFLQDQHYLSYADEAVRTDLLNLDAVEAPAGTMRVILGPGWPGVLLHEAVGHGLEGDFNRRGSSVFSGRIGERVAAAGCTVVDNGTLPDRRGSLGIDDEGTPTQNTVLIEDGILKSYMQDKQNARLMGVQPTGNGRRESYADLVMPRMTNTYMLAGDYKPEEIIAAVDKGIYAVNFAGGQVDITSGKFVFSASEAYLVENGKLGKPVKGATLIGNGADALTKISMLGDDLALDQGVGTCGKDGQSVPVGVGQPTMLIDELTVGGTGT